MSHNTRNQMNSKPFYTIIGMLIGALLALTFAKIGSPGLIGVGAVLGVSIGNALYRRSKETN